MTLQIVRADVVPQFTTVGKMAGRLGVPLHRVVYVLKTRRGIRPAARAGRLRLFDRAAVEAVRRELAHIDARQREGVCDVE